MVSSIVSSRSREGFRRPSDREDIVYRDRGQLGLYRKDTHDRGASQLPACGISLADTRLEAHGPWRAHSGCIATPMRARQQTWLSAATQARVLQWLHLPERTPRPCRCLSYRTLRL